MKMSGKSCLFLAVLLFAAAMPAFAGLTGPTCTLAVTPTVGSAPLTVSANGSCTEAGVPNLPTTIDWGDDSSSPGPTATHTYFTPGSYIVTIIAVDPAQQTGSANQTVTVNPPPALFLGVNTGKILGINPDGTTATTLDTKLSGTMTGMTFDVEGLLYATAFSAGNLVRFGSDLSPLGNFGPALNCQPESVTTDFNGNIYVGLAGCNKTVVKLDAKGTQLSSFTVANEDQGADWIELSADQCTLYYTSEGHRILRYNVCGNRQLSDFSSGLHKALAIKLLSDGGTLVADNIDIHRTDATGIITKTYDQPGEDCWVSVALDSDGVSFWATDSCTSHVYQMDLATGNVLQTIKPNIPPNSVFGLAVSGFSSGSFNFVNANPPTNTIPTGGTATFTVSLNGGGLAAVRPQLATSSDKLILNCSNLPVGAKCDFSPTAIALGETSTLKISTNNTQVGKVVLPNRFAQPDMLAMIGSFPFALGLFGFRRRSKHRKALFTSLAIGVLLILIACGGSNTKIQTTPAQPVGVPQAGTTPPGTYTVNISAGNGPSLSTNSVTLTVQ